MRSYKLMTQLTLGGAALWLISGCGGGGGTIYPLAVTTRAIQAGDRLTYTVTGTLKDLEGHLAPLSGTLTQTVEDALLDANMVKALVITGSVNAGSTVVSLDGTTFVKQDPTTHVISLAGDDHTGGGMNRIAPVGTKFLPSPWTLTTNYSDTVTFDDGSTLGRTFTVVGQERVRVPAGTFETWKVQETAIDDAGTTSTLTNWYAPQLGWFVRSEFSTVSFGATLNFISVLKSTNVPLHE